MVNESEWNITVTKLNKRLMKLYLNGKLSLVQLQEFQAIVKETDIQMKMLFTLQNFHLKKRSLVEDDMLQLNNIFQSMYFGLLAA